MKAWNKGVGCEVVLLGCFQWAQGSLPQPNPHNWPPWTPEAPPEVTSTQIGSCIHKLETTSSQFQHHQGTPQFGNAALGRFLSLPSAELEAASWLKSKPSKGNMTMSPLLLLERSLSPVPLQLCHVAVGESRGKEAG